MQSIHDSNLGRVAAWLLRTRWSSHVVLINMALPLTPCAVTKHCVIDAPEYRLFAFYGNIGQWKCLDHWTPEIRVLFTVPQAIARRLFQMVFDYDPYRVRV